MILRTSKRLHTLALSGRSLVHVLGDGRGTYETDRRRFRTIQQGIDCDAISVDDVEDTGGKPSFGQQLRQSHAAARVLLGGLEDKRVTTGDRNGEHPQWNHDRKIKRCDADTHADRLSQRPAVNIGTDAIRKLAFEQMRNATRKLDYFHAASDFAACIREHLA